jgi:hypothetical protein
MIPIDPVSTAAAEPVKWEAAHPAVTPAQPAAVPARTVVAPVRQEAPAGGGGEDKAREPMKLAGPGEGSREAATPAHAGAAAPALPSVGTRVTLSQDAELRQTIIRVTDPESGELIRQIPSEESLRLQHRYLEEAQKQAEKHDRGVA